MPDWFRIDNPHDVPSPALLVSPDHIRENIRRMLEMTGGPDRLRPHVKTHKTAEIIRLQCDAGISKFKCATIAEAEMVASAGGTDILMAYQPVGPNASRLATLASMFPETSFATVVDDEPTARSLSAAFERVGRTVGVMIDLDVGMHRTGIDPHDDARSLYRCLDELPGLEPRGLHAYDGHNTAADLDERRRCYDEYMPTVWSLRDAIVAMGLSVPTVVASGTPAFPLHAAAGDVECSPGTCVLWDFGYDDAYDDLPFVNAAILLIRVISKPEPDLICLDLGHKAVASENPHPRVRLIDVPVDEVTTQSEEHLTVRTPRAGELNVGAVVYGIPRHICPTVSMYSELHVVDGGRATDRWTVTARGRRITV